MHPDPAVRGECRLVVASVVGAERLGRAVDSVRDVVAPFESDFLEPFVMLEEDYWVIAVLQLICQAVPDQQTHRLRITNPDSFDLAGGVALTGLDACARVSRRAEDGQWNYARGAAYHPSLLRAWVDAATTHRVCRVASTTVHGAAVLKIPKVASGLDHIVQSFTDIGDLSIPLWFQAWTFGGCIALSPPMNRNDSPALAFSADGIALALASLQKDSCMLPEALSLGDIGALATFSKNNVELRFKTPESIMRLAAIASQPRMFQLSAIRPWGWLVFGRGEDDIVFIRSVHAVPPMWAQLSKLPTLPLNPDLHSSLARWVGPCAHEITHEFLESLI
jgi:hypothetical protein